MPPVQLRKRVHLAGQGKVCLTGVPVEGHLRRAGPQVHAATRVSKGQRLLVGGHVEAHEQLAPCVDVEDVGQTSQAGGLTELTLAFRKGNEREDTLGCTKNHYFRHNTIG